MKKIFISFLIVYFSFFIFQMGDAQIIHVPSDQPTIQAGINSANPGDTVLVAEGTYYEQIDFLGKKPLMVASHFLIDNDTNHINNTVIDGSQLSPDIDNASVVYFRSGEDTTSLLCGFTITGGSGTYIPDLNTRNGGGVFIRNAGAKICNNIITNHYLNDESGGNGENVFGGGIGTANEDGDFWIVISDNRISDNLIISHYEMAIGCGVYTAYNSRISGNVIEYNTCRTTGAGWAVGGGIGHFASDDVDTLLIHNNIINQNVNWSFNGMASDGGASIVTAYLIFTDNYVSENSSVTSADFGGVGGLTLVDPPEGCIISGNTFVENVSTHIAGALHLENYYGTELNKVVITDNIFIDNVAENGGAIYDLNIPLYLENNIWIGNEAIFSGGAVNLVNNTTETDLHLAVFVNCTFTGNSAEYCGALHALDAKPLIFNSIFYNDSASIDSLCEIYLPSPDDTLFMAFTNINTALVAANIMDAGGNFKSDPEFIDDTCHIDEFSPCEDQGADSILIKGTWYYAPSTDFEGTPRPWHMDIDVGADECSIITGFDETSGLIPGSGSRISCYPNPCQDIVHSAFNIAHRAFVMIGLYNLQGQKIKTLLDKELYASEHDLIFDVSGLTDGLYFLKVTAGEETVTKKLIVMH